MSAIPVAFPVINGVLYDFSSIEAVFGPAGRISIAMKTIDYSRKRDRDYPHGAHPDPLGKTQGVNTYSATAELYLPAWLGLRLSLGPGYGDTPFPIFVTYNAFGMPPMTDQLIGCTVDEKSVAHAQGKNALFAKVNLGPVKILEDGTDDVLIPLIASNL